MWPVEPTTLPHEESLGQGLLALSGLCALLMLQEAALNSPGREWGRANGLVPRGLFPQMDISPAPYGHCVMIQPQRPWVWLSRSEDLLCAGSGDVQEPPSRVGVQLILVPAQCPHIQHTQHLVLRE